MNKKDNKSTKVSFIFAVGRRLEAVARVRLYSNPSNVIWNEQQLGKGDILVNGLPVGKYFSGPVAREKYLAPLKAVSAEGKFGITVKVSGGGNSGQLDAFIQGLARALDKFDSETNHNLLKKHGFLTRDARARERRKVGTGGKARRKKQSPKR